MSGQPVQSFLVPKPGKEVTRSSRAAKEKCPQVLVYNKEEGTLVNFATDHGGYNNTSTNSTHITPSRPVKELNLFNLTNEASTDMPGSECWEIPDPARSNPPSEKMMLTHPLEKYENSVLMTRDKFFESCSRGDKCDEKIINAPHSATTSKAKAVVNMEALNLSLSPPSTTLAPRPPRIPNFTFKLLALKGASRSSHEKKCHVISSRTPHSETQHVTKGEPSSREQTIILFGKILTITSPAEEGEGTMKHRRGKEPVPTSPTEKGEGTMMHRSGKELVSTMSVEEGERTMKHRSGKEPVPTSPSEKGEGTIKHRSGKEPVTSDLIRREETVKIKADDESEHKRKALSLSWFRNQRRLHKRNINVVREMMMSRSAEQEVEEKKVPSVAAVAMVGRVLNDAPRCKIKKMNGYSVWD